MQDSLDTIWSASAGKTQTTYSGGPMMVTFMQRSSAAAPGRPPSGSPEPKRERADGRAWRGGISKGPSSTSGGRRSSGPG